MDPRNYSLHNAPPRRPPQYDPVHSASAPWVSQPPNPGPSYLWATNPPGLPQPWNHHVQQSPGPDSFQLAQNGGLPQPGPMSYGLPPPSMNVPSGEYPPRQVYHFHRLLGQQLAPQNHPGLDNRIYQDQAVSSRLAGFRAAAHAGAQMSSHPATSELNSPQTFAPPELGANTISQHNAPYLSYPPPPLPIHPFQSSGPRHTHTHHHHTHHHPHHHVPSGSTRPMSVTDLPHVTRSSTTSSGPRRTIRTRRSVAVRTMDDEDELRPALSERYAASLSAAAMDEDAALRQMQVIRGSMTSKLVASKATLQSLIAVKVDDLPETERNCIICYNEFGVKTPEGIIEIPIRLPKCGHVFGEHCIKQWLEDSDSCPYCRDKLHSEPRIRGTNARSLIDLMRMRALSGARTVTVQDIADHLMDDGAWELSTRGQQERRSPPLDTNEPSRRTRARRTGSSYPGNDVDVDALFGISRSAVLAQDASPRVIMPPMRHSRSPTRQSTRTIESTASAHDQGAPTIANGSQQLRPTGSNFWPQGWMAPGEADIVANPLHSNHSSSGESEGEA